ncbi:MAG TPA: hypothetical protein VGI39_34595 [Polyangiaceae bacterium]
MLGDLRSAAFAVVLSLPLLGCSASPAAGPAEDAGTTPSSGTSGNAAPADAGSADSGPPVASIEAGSGSATGASLTLDIPPTFKGTPRELDVVVTATLPIAGPPAAVLYQAKNPAVTAGQLLPLHGDAAGVAGNYFVVAVLYMQGGGQFSPASGVDYEAQSAKTFAFTGGAMDLGTMSLALAGADAGP